MLFSFSSQKCSIPEGFAEECLELTFTLKSLHWPFRGEWPAGGRSGGREARERAVRGAGGFNAAAGHRKKGRASRASRDVGKVTPKGVHPAVCIVLGQDF